MFTPSSAIQQDCQILFTRAFDKRVIKVGRADVGLNITDVKLIFANDDTAEGEVIGTVSNVSYMSELAADEMIKQILKLLSDQGIDETAITNVRVAPKSFILKFDPLKVLDW